MKVGTFFTLKPCKGIENSGSSYAFSHAFSHAVYTTGKALMVKSSQAHLIWLHISNKNGSIFVS